MFKALKLQFLGFRGAFTSRFPLPTFSDPTRTPNPNRTPNPSPNPNSNPNP